MFVLCSFMSCFYPPNALVFGDVRCKYIPVRCKWSARLVNSPPDKICFVCTAMYVRPVRLKCDHGDRAFTSKKKDALIKVCFGPVQWRRWGIGLKRGSWTNGDRESLDWRSREYLDRSEEGEEEVSAGRRRKRRPLSKDGGREGLKTLGGSKNEYRGKKRTQKTEKRWGVVLTLKGSRQDLVRKRVDIDRKREENDVAGWQREKRG